MEDHAELEWYTCKNITRICWKNITNSPKEWKKKNLTGINFFMIKRNHEQTRRKPKLINRKCYPESGISWRAKYKLGIMLTVIKQENLH